MSEVVGYVCGQDDVLNEIENVLVASRAKVFKYVAAFSVEDTEGLGKVVSLKEGERGKERGKEREGEGRRERYIESGGGGEREGEGWERGKEREGERGMEREGERGKEREVEGRRERERGEGEREFYQTGSTGRLPLTSMTEPSELYSEARTEFCKQKTYNIHWVWLVNRLRPPIFTNSLMRLERRCWYLCGLCRGRDRR